MVGECLPTKRTLEGLGNSYLPVMIQRVSGASANTNRLRKWGMSWQFWWHKNIYLLPVLGSLEIKNAPCYFKTWIFELKKFKMFI